MNLPANLKHDLTEANIYNVIGKMMTCEQADCPVTHHFGPNIYIREVRIKAGVFSIGHYQKTEHLNYMVKGKVLMLQEDGTTKEVSAPYLYTAKPGRKIGLILEDMVWWNIYSTSETNVEALEETYLDKGSLDYSEQKRLKQALAAPDDYEQMLEDLGVTEEQVRKESENPEDQIPFPYGSLNVVVSNSPIEGMGLFATSDFKKGDLIVMGRIDGKRTPAGRYTNHSPYPNAKFVLINNDAALIALRDIKGCQGGELGEEITVNYREVRKLCQA